MEARHKILVLDDESGWLNMCRDFLAQLPSKPDIRTVSSGMRALALLDEQPFQLLLCDLRMPKMDGLQVLSIVRRRFPQLRTVALTGFAEEDFRSRAYALGVDMFWLKLDMQQNPQMFLECIESLLGRDGGGSSEIQNKNILDVIQMEAALRNSSVLRVTSGWRVAQVWMKDGELVDVRAEGADGEAALWRLLKWKGVTFESLPADPAHVRIINKSLDALLLELAQAVKKAENPTPAQEEEETAFVARLTAVAYEGAEFVMTVSAKKEDTVKGWGIRDVERLGAWVRQAEKTAQRLGVKFNAGPLSHIAGHNPGKHILVMPRNGRTLVIGWPPETDPRHLFERSKKLADSWAS